jgi:hypothetical protein
MPIKMVRDLDGRLVKDFDMDEFGARAKELLAEAMRARPAMAMTIQAKCDLAMQKCTTQQERIIAALKMAVDSAKVGTARLVDVQERLVKIDEVIQREVK